VIYGVEIMNHDKKWADSDISPRNKKEKTVGGGGGKGDIRRRSGHEVQGENRSLLRQGPDVKKQNPSRISGGEMCERRSQNQQKGDKGSTVKKGGYKGGCDTKGKGGCSLFG